MTPGFKLTFHNKEQVIERALGSVFHDKNYQTLLTMANKTSLCNRQLQNITLLISVESIKKSLSIYVPPCDLRWSHISSLPKCLTSYGLKSIRHLGPNSPNSLKIILDFLRIVVLLN